MVAPVRWVKVVRTLARMRVGGSSSAAAACSPDARDFEIPSLRASPSTTCVPRLYGQAQNFLPRQNGVSLQVSGLQVSLRV